MTSNERWLSIVLLTCVAGWGGLSLWETWIKTPAESHDVALTQLNGEIQGLTQQLKTVKAAEQRVEKFSERAQLGDPKDLVYDYQKWLIERAENKGLTHITLTPLPTQELSDELIRLPFSLSGRGSREQLLELIADLSEATFPHRINSLRLEAVRVGRETLPGLRLSSELELVTAVNSDEPTQTLSTKNDIGTERLVQNLNKHLQFAPYQPQPKPKATQIVVRPTKPNVPPKIYQLIALVEDAGEFQAWFYCQKDRKRSVLRIDEKLGEQHAVLQIDGDNVVLAVHEKPQKLALGDKIRIEQTQN